MEAKDVLAFWFSREADWFRKSDAFDAELRARFLSLYERHEELQGWMDDARGCLARIVLLDQFPRNMFRGTPRAFATDSLALQSARHARTRGYEQSYSMKERIFAAL